MTVTVVVTRPQPQADDWVARLQALGQAARALPLMRIERAAAFDADVARTWAGLARHRLVMFVSPNAVLAFFAGRPAGLRWPAATLAGATGPGTVASLQAQGVDTACIVSPPKESATFDAESLWRHALASRDWAGQSVLVVRGEDGRDWLADTLARAGASVACLAAYRRVPPVWPGVLAAALDQVAAQPARHVWLFSSSQCITHLLAPQAPAAADAALRAAVLAVPVLATHPRIADTARHGGFHRVVPVAPEPVAVARAAACRD
ncbi:uroporphyrinogen-III synthase [Sphaerotilus sp.]|uniref:uroporphyrinogen-III synthase n=1 Tax=Sphaerotilus sp. TaxID=2093942 RepID=UPI002ACE6D12|nr:uroporphyrinogen-III synthase [Sphaerotilus sp.]MDZ7857798.1 uroporphyrinogen-III synthase [Sphaerotilus sp.]